MKSSWPLFAPLKMSYQFDAALLAEAQKLKTLTNRDPITYDGNVSRHDVDGILTQHLGLSANNVYHKDLSGKIHDGQLECFRSLNLTWIQGEEASKHQQFYQGEQGQTRAYLFKPHAHWLWRDDLSADELKRFVLALPFEKITLVRLIYLIPPAEGGVHIDTSVETMNNYYSNSGGSLTFNLLSGDGSLHFLNQKEIHRIDPALTAWHFNPSAPHSVGKVEKLRIQLRVFGQIQNQKYAELLDLNQAIYSLLKV